jgi:hypothetical protein
MIIHQVWVGDDYPVKYKKWVGDDYPVKYKKWANKIQELNPSFEYKLHTIPKTNTPIIPASNIERLRIMYEEGGMYLDCDMEPVAPFPTTFTPGTKIYCDPLWGKPHYAFILVEKGNSIIGKIYEEFKTTVDYWTTWQKYTKELSVFNLPLFFKHHMDTSCQ